MSKSGMMVLVCVMAAAGGLRAAGAGPRELDLAQRISAQRAIEGVYWRHRIWPADNAAQKPPLSQVLPESALRATVENSMLESKALDQLWGRPITNDELEAEIDRMVSTSRAPAVLEEIIAALGNDPVLVTECLARPILADRLIREAYARDPRYHQDLRNTIEHALARSPGIAGLRREGDYAEAVWVLGGGRPERARTQAGGRVVRMSADTWGRSLARLQEGFDPGSTRAQAAARVEDLPVGIVSALQEDDESFFVQAVLEKDAARVRVATVAWRKTHFDAWWAGMKAALSSPAPSTGSGADGETATGGVAALDAMPSIPVISAPGCIQDTWSGVQSSGAPSAREAFTAIWTGTEMIVWGGYNGTTNLDTNTGGRYTPATNSWAATPTTGAPEARDTHVAVWTGTKMIVWGGGNEVFVPKDTGSRYDPATNLWQATTTSGAPAARLYHVAVWSGAKMVVWGGWNGTKDIDTGGLYDPAADSWGTTAKAGSPLARDAHTAIWSGSRMVIWGGEDDNALPLDTGALYDPVGNAWSGTTATNVPAARWLHTAVWTGSRMIVWGGFDGTADVNTGATFDPVANVWALTSTTNAPVARELHVAVWADALSEMIVWGGQNDAVVQLSTGGRYNPATGVWQATSTAGAPISGRYGVVSWTGSEMIVWGGFNQADLSTGGRYCDAACTAPPPAGSSVVSVASQVGGEMVSWTAVTGADMYDLVRGSLALLTSSGGDFTASTGACLANDQAGVSFLDATVPAMGGGFWYLVRGLSCGGAGSYDSIGGSQVGSRDAEINASPNSCP